MTKKYIKSGSAPTHPGLILKHGFVEEYNFKVETVANFLGITREHLSRILNGNKDISIDIAIKLEILTRTPATQWLALQTNFDLYHKKQKKQFSKYVENVEEYLEAIEELSPQERRKDDGLRKLVTDTAVLAKGISGKAIKK